jgi:hypothetical protein
MPEQTGRVLAIAGGLLLLLGLVLMAGGRLGLGRLPGDIVVRKENFVFYFPLMTGILLSLALSLLFYLLRRI